MTVPFGDIHSGLQHEDGEGYPWNPGNKAYDGEDTEDCEHDRGRVVVAQEIVDRSSNANHDIQYARDPYFHLISRSYVDSNDVGQFRSHR